MNILHIEGGVAQNDNLTEVLHDYSLNITKLELEGMMRSKRSYDQYDLIILEELKSTMMTLELLSMLFKKAERPMTKSFKTILITEATSFEDERLTYYLPYLSEGHLFCILRKDAEQHLRHYMENQYFLNTLSKPNHQLKRKDYKVLVVDDSSLYRNMVARALSTAGFQVVKASDGVEAYDIYKKDRIMAIITDIEMPGMTGVELCEKIREEDEYLEIFFISSILKKDVIDKVYHIGAGDFFGKPLDLNRLTRKIESHYNTLSQKMNFRAMVIAKDREYRERVKQHLSQNAFRAYSAVNGIEGLMLTLVNNIQVVITEAELHFFNGYDYLNATNRAAEMDRMIKIVVSDSFEPRKMKATANDVSIQFFPKALDLVPMVNRIEQQLFSRIGYVRREQEMFLSSIQSLIVALEERDRYTRGHSERVAKYSKLIASELGMSTMQTQLIELAATLHDIGKITVPDAVLLKPGSLSNQEYEIIKKHTAVGYKILQEIDSLSYVSEIIRQHHERLDGKGYPLGLKAEQISLEARIIAVADTYDAMTTERPYRKVMPSDEAIKRLMQAKDTQLDGRCVDALTKQIRGKK